MGWLEGVLTGYADRHYQIQKEKRAEAELAANRESQVLSTLLSSEHPEIRDLASAGVLDLANPRRRSGGIAGWMGEMEKSPYLAMIQRARAQIEQDQQDPESTTAAELGRGAPPPTPSIPTQAGSVPGQPSAGLPSTSLVEGGPATAPTPAPPPPPPGSVGAVSFAPGAQQAAAGAGAAGGAPGVPRPSVSFAPGAAAAGPGIPRSSASFAPPPAPPGQAAPPAQAGAPPQPLAGPPLPMAAAAPPPPGQIGIGQPGATTGQVGRLPPPRSARTQLPGIFPTAADLARNREEAEVQGQVRAWQTLYRMKGDPDWEQKGIDAVLTQRRAAGGSTLREGNARQLSDGSWVQDLYDSQTGQVVNTIPTPGPQGGGTVQTREAIAFSYFGNQGEDPRATIRRLTPAQMARVMVIEREEKALTAAEVALARAEAMADAPLAAQAKNALIETLNSKWQRLQESPREMARQFGLMQTGMKRFNEGDRLGGAQAILVTFQKMLDPISVVRESEYARSSAGLSLIGQLEGWWDKLKAGGAGVPPEDMEKMVETARQFLEGIQGWNDTERGRIEDRAASHGIDPGFIFGGGLRTPTPTPTTGAPSAAGGTAAATPDPKAAPGAVNWDSPLRYDPVTRRMVPAG